MQESTRKGRLIALGILLFISFLSVLRVAAPLWVGMAFGTFMAFTAQPTYRWLAAKLGNRKSLAAVITTVVMGVTWTALGALTVYVLARELFTLIGVLQAKFAQESLSDVIGQRGVVLLEKLGINRASLTAKIQSELSAASNSIASAAGVILSTTSSAVLGLIVGLMTMYYVLIEWPRLPLQLERVLPLDPRHTRSLVIEFRDVCRSALVGTIATALVQGLSGGVGYWICGIPHPVTWALLTALASLIPAVGTALVWIPIGLYLLFTGHTAYGVLELAWGTLVVVVVCDYVIRPRLVGSKGKGHPLLMLIGLLGGIEVFGLTGLIVGPVIMSLFVAILRIYERELSWESVHPPGP